MTEQFRKVAGLGTTNVAAIVSTYDDHTVIIDIDDDLTVPEARALRDWLNKALPESDDAAATFFCQNAGYICERCGRHKYRHFTRLSSLEGPLYCFSNTVLSLKPESRCNHTLNQRTTLVGEMPNLKCGQCGWVLSEENKE